MVNVERTSIPIPELCHLVELCLRSTYFQFGQTFFEQVQGAAMGSLLSPIVANIFMEDLETQALEMSPHKPRMWLRYVDDVFTIWPHGDCLLEIFYQHLNGQSASIQFTMVREREVKIAFLDVQIERQGTVTQTSVFRKKTHTDRYLDFNSHHPAKVLQGVVQCLRVRAEKVCEEGKRWNEIQHLRQVFRANGYLEPVVKNNLRGRTTPSNTNMESEIPPKLLHLPYVNGVNEQIEKMYCPLGVKTVMKTAYTLRS